ncbi:MAG: 3-dehydroquinate dehydratase [Roseobacter sp. MedPE-SWchi]|nr:MAG: 3-dehydroquinate dehydratase [Roseobacter sp. MedPE-SWchi]
MQIAYTLAQGRGDTDQILHQLSQRLLAAGHAPCGVVQINSERTDSCRCDMDVQVLPAGPVIRISQTLGEEARGCRLDPAALEEAVALTERALQQGAEMLIINKFGKHEAEGRGFRAAIGEALGLGLPVLVGLNHLNQEAFFEFIGDLGVALRPDVAALEVWAKAQLATQPGAEPFAAENGIAEASSGPSMALSSTAA